MPMSRLLQHLQHQHSDWKCVPFTKAPTGHGSSIVWMNALKLSFKISLKISHKLSIPPKNPLKNFEKARTKNIKSYPCDQLLSRRNLELVQHIINRGARGDSQLVRARNTSNAGGIINSLKRIRSINNLYWTQNELKTEQKIPHISLTVRTLYASNVMNVDCCILSSVWQ